MAPFLPSVLRAAFLAWVVLHGVAFGFDGMSESTGIEVDPRALRNILWINGAASLAALVEIRRQRPQVFLGNLGISWKRLWGTSFAALLGAELVLQIVILITARG